MRTNFLLLIIFFFIISCKRNGDGTVTVVPVTPEGLTGSLTSSTSITLNWVDKSTNETGFKIQRKTGAESFADIATVNKDVTSYVNSSLNVNTAYTYRVYAYNEAGSSLSYTNELTISTAAPAVLTTATISEISNVSAKSGGTITSDGGSPVTERGVVWGTAANPTIALTTKTNDGTGTGTFTSNITGLSLNTTYYVRAYATNGAGTVYGNEISFTTLNVDVTSGLLAYYPFNGNANDASGNGYNGDVVGAILSTDKNGVANKAYSFTANTHRIRIPNLYQNNISSYTITGWFNKLSTSASQEGTIVSGTFCNSPVSRTGLRFFAGNTNLLRWAAESSSCQDGVYSTTTQFQPSDGLWHHFAVTFESPNGPILPSAFNIYVDGILVSQSRASQISSTPSAPLNNQNLPILIGNNECGCDYFPGSLDEIRIYNRVLTQGQISYLFNN